MVVAPLGPFADPEAVLIEYLARVAPVDVATPDPGEFDGEAIRVVRTGGPDDGRRDYPRMEVACFASTAAGGYDRAVAMGETCRQLLLALPGEAIALAATAHHGGQFVIVDSCRTATPPERVPVADPGISHDVAYYQLALPRPRELTPARHAAALNPPA